MTIMRGMTSCRNESDIATPVARRYPSNRTRPVLRSDAFTLGPPTCSLM